MFNNYIKDKNTNEIKIIESPVEGAFLYKHTNIDIVNKEEYDEWAIAFYPNHELEENCND